MSLRIIEIEQKIKAVESVLIGIRRDGGVRVSEESADALKEVAKDLRARLPGTQSETILEIERRLDAVQKSKHPRGYSNETLIALAQDIIRRWPVIRQALEREETP